MSMLDFFMHSEAYGVGHVNPKTQNLESFPMSNGES